MHEAGEEWTEKNGRACGQQECLSFLKMITSLGLLAVTVERQVTQDFAKSSDLLC